MTSTSDPVLTGGCRCGAITYTSTALPSGMTNCFCCTCRRISGAPYLPFFGFATQSLSWIISPDSALERTRYSSIATRTHCSKCGSPLSMQFDFQPNKISITAGSVHDESVKGSLPACEEHIFVSEKPSWYNLPDDGLPRYDGYDDGFDSIYKKSLTEQK